MSGYQYSEDVFKRLVIALDLEGFRGVTHDEALASIERQIEIGDATVDQLFSAFIALVHEKEKLICELKTWICTLSEENDGYKQFLTPSSEVRN